MFEKRASILFKDRLIFGEGLLKRKAFSRAGQHRQLFLSTRSPVRQNHQSNLSLIGWNCLSIYISLNWNGSEKKINYNNEHSSLSLHLFVWLHPSLHHVIYSGRTDCSSVPFLATPRLATEPHPVKKCTWQHDLKCAPIHTFFFILKKIP